MTDNPLHTLLLRHLADPDGRTEAVLTALVRRELPKASPAVVRSALGALARAGACERAGDRWFARRTTPVDAAAVRRFRRDGVALPGLSARSAELDFAKEPGASGPSPAQVLAVARLVEDPRRVAAIVTRELGAGTFDVTSVWVRAGLGGRSHLVLNGSCSRDPEHGFAIELDGDEVVAVGGASTL